MKLTTLNLAASIMTAPVQSSSLRGLFGDTPSSNKSGEESKTDIAIIGGESDQGDRKLLSSWCAEDTPTLWHPDYEIAWSAAGCILTADCNSPGYDTEQECCKGSYGGQTSGACTGGGSAPTTVQWYADYGTAWPNAGCKSDWPYPNYAAVFFNSELECCKSAFGGQTSGACVGGLPNSPTMAPITVGGVGGKWYADYATPWSNAGCKNTAPYPTHAAIIYSSQLACCKAAFGGQVSGACIKGLLSPPTKKPTAKPTSKPTAAPTLAPTSRPTSTPTVTPTITIVASNTITLPLATNSTISRRELRRLDYVSSAFKEVIKKTIETLLQGTLNSGQTLIEVRINNATYTRSTVAAPFGVLVVIFDVIITEKCITSCESQQTTTQLKVSANKEITESIADGSFVQTLMNETRVALSQNGALSNDTLLSVVDNLNGAVGAATVNFTISVAVTTSSPTNAPTSIPTMAPTSNPSEGPSENPSGNPSANPSSYPSLNPSSNPSEGPSENPSGNPSVGPSSHPSLNPSSNPSEGPSKNPSGNPSGNPSTSSYPSLNPSSNPSEGPSENPSGNPSGNPSSHPSTSSYPSLNPSSNPSEGPSENPSGNPSGNPSSRPSLNPSSNPSEGPSESPSGTPLTFVKTVSTLLAKGANDYVDPAAQWYYSDMRPANLTGATAEFVTLQTEVSSGGKNATLVSGAPNNITSALRLYTRLSPATDKAEVGIKFYDGLFNGMKFKDMVAQGISFEYSFFKATVVNGSDAAAPAIKMAVYSPSTRNFTTFVWEPYVGGAPSGNPAKDVWLTKVVTNTTGTNATSGTGGSGWWRTGWFPTSSLGSSGTRQNYVRNLATWANYFNTSMPLDMSDAVVISVSIGVGSGNIGVTSYVNSLRIAVGDYDWKWSFVV